MREYYRNEKYYNIMAFESFRGNWPDDASILRIRVDQPEGWGQTQQDSRS